MRVPYTLALVGGILIVFTGLLLLLVGFFVGTIPFLPEFFPFSFFSTFTIGFGLLGIISGGVIIFSAMRFDTQKRKKYSSVAIIFSLLSLLILYGFVIGPLLSLIGGYKSYRKEKDAEDSYPKIRK